MFKCKVKDLLEHKEWLPVINENLKELNPDLPTLRKYLAKRSVYSDSKAILLLDKEGEMIAHCWYDLPSEFTYGWMQEIDHTAILPPLDKTMVLLNLATSREYRGKGYGKIIVDEMVRDILRNETWCLHIIANTEQAGRRFYVSKCGFRTIASIKDDVLVVKDV